MARAPGGFSAKREKESPSSSITMCGGNTKQDRQGTAAFLSGLPSAENSGHDVGFNVGREMIHGNRSTCV
jgi:hypothetical protein